MVVYITVLILVTTLLYLSRRKVINNRLKKSLIYVAFGILLFVSAIRYDVGTDFLEYERIFERNTFSVSVERGYLSDNIEASYLLLCNVIHLFSENSFWIFFVTSFIIIFFLMKTYVGEVKYYDIAVYLFITFGLYTSSFNIIRQWMATAIWLYSFRFLLDKKEKWKYFLCAVFATFWHYSAIFMFVVYFILCIKIKSYIRNIVVIGATAVYFLSDYILSLVSTVLKWIPYLNDKYSVYFTRTGQIYSNVFIWPMFCLFTYLIYVFFYKNKKNRKIELYVNVLVLAYIVSLLGCKIFVFSRLQFFFVPILTLIIPEMLEKLVIKQKKLVIFLIMFFGMLYFIYGMWDDGEIVKYKTIFTKELKK